MKGSSYNKRPVIDPDLNERFLINTYFIQLEEPNPDR